MCHFGEQGWRSGERTRLPPMRPGFSIYSERFLPSPPLKKTNISKFQFDKKWQRKNHSVDVLPLTDSNRYLFDFLFFKQVATFPFVQGIPKRDRSSTD